MFLKVRLVALLLLVFLAFNVHANEPKLIFAVDVIRHGDRTALRDLPSKPHQWQEGRGQLTATGMRQLYELGTKFRQRYVHESQLLSENYQPKSVFIRSTDVDRTLMSAQSLLCGLYPMGTGPKVAPTHNEAALPGAFQPIPIHTKNDDDGDVLLVDTHGDLFLRNFHQHVKTHPAWIEKDKALRPHYQRWSKATGVEIKEIQQLISLGNILYIYQLKGIALPASLTKKDISQIMEAGNWAFCYSFKHESIAKAMGKPLLNLIVENLNKASPSNELKYMLLSGHDSSILALMSAMGVPLEEAPNYAANVNFAVYEKNKDKRYVVVSYNDKSLTLPSCQGTQCELEELSKLAGVI